MKRIVLIIGTRPEAIKLIPVYLELKKSSFFSPEIIFTGQHDEMVRGIWELFHITPEHSIDVMRKGQGLADLTGHLFHQIPMLLQRINPDGVIVQGDTTTAFAGAMVSLYSKIPVFHVEAGLRTYQKYSPFPEEVNRQIISRIATIHFAATKESVKNLLSENPISKHIELVGNTVVDALEIMQARVNDSPRLHEKYVGLFAEFDFLVLITGHRRENLDNGIDELCTAILKLANDNPQTCFLYPVHYNPEVRAKVYAQLGEVFNILLTDPLPYDEMLYIMSQSELVITDSGGIQEEAPSLKIPVIITRDYTERMEGVNAGFAILTGCRASGIVDAFQDIFANSDFKERIKTLKNPFGDGQASQKIVNVLKRFFETSGNEKTFKEPQE